MADHAFAVDDLDGARGRDLVDGDQKGAVVQSCQFNGPALECIVQGQLVSVDEIVSSFALESRSVRVLLTVHLLEGDIQIGSRTFGLLVTLAFQGHCVRALHTRFHINSCLGLLRFNSATVESQHLLLVVDCLAGAVVKLFQSDIHDNIDVLRGLRGGLVQSTVCSAKVTPLNLEVSSRNLGQVRAQVEEWVRLEEELVEDLIAVLLVLIPSTVDSVWTHDAQSESLVTIFFENCAQAHVRKHLVRLADQMELRQVEAHLGWVLQRVVLQSILFESAKILIDKVRDRRGRSLFDNLLTRC